MKTRTKLLLPLMLLCIAVSALTLTAAAAEPTLTLSASSGAARGETLEVQLLLTGNPGIWGPLVRVSYDAGQLELLSVANGEIYADSELMANVERNPVIISFNQQSLKNNYKNGKLATLKFRVKEAATANVTTIGISSYEIINCDETSVTFRTVDAAVTICSMHSFGEWQTVREATEAEDGERIRTCRNCGYVERETISVPKTGICGDNLTYTLDTNTGVLIISGTGKMENWNSESAVPWYSYRSSIRTVQISKAVTSIGAYAFHSCGNLTNITIPSRVTSIGAYAFQECSALNAVYITDLAAWCRISFGDDALVGSAAANPLFNAHNLYLNGELVTELIIPDSVMDIGRCAFYGCSSLESITIPDSVTSIERSAFCDCSSLASITIPDSVTSIGAWAFSGCSDLASVTIPDSATSIGWGAFNNCSSLTSIKIPDGVASIMDYTFSGCSNLESITIPDSVTSIGRFAFQSCSRLTNITIPDKVTSIGRFAFQSCSRLTNITIPDKVTSIGWSAFQDCSSLASITIPFVGASLDAKKGYDQVLGHIFGYTTKTEDGTTEQYDGYYYYIPSTLRSVTVTSVTTIPQNAFRACRNLASITIGNSVTSIGEQAFSGCSSLTSITIPESVTSIGRNAFLSCSRLNAVYITDLAAWCRISFDDDASGGNVANPLYHAHELYLNGELVTELVIPDSVTSIGLSSFRGCKSLTSITIPDSVTSIEDYAFCACSSLTSITIPNRVTSIGKCAFYNCSSLTSISIPDSVTSIGLSSFRGCKSLTSITIPDSVASIGSYAFYGCSSLTSITIMSPDCQIDDSQDTISSTATIYGYTGSTAAAYAEKYERTFVSIGETCGKKLIFRMDLDTGVLSITGTGAMDSWYFDDSPWYAYRTSIRLIQIASGATSIGDFAFDGCSNLVDVEIAETVESIGDGAFDNCTSLAKVTILNDTCKIPDRADAFPTSVTIHGNAGSTAEAYAKKYNRAFAQIGHTHVYAEDYTVDVPASCTTAGVKSRHCTVEGCTETIDSTVIPAAGHKFGAWTIIREATLDDTGERTHTCEVCGTSETETMPKRVRGDADGDGAVMIRDALLTLRAVLDGAAMDPYMDANGDGKLMLADVLLILRLAVA